MKKLALVMAMLMAVTAVLTPPVAAAGTTPEGTEPEIIYFENFNDYNDGATDLGKLTWAATNNNTLGSLSVANDKLTVDKTGTKYVNLLILDGDEMATGMAEADTDNYTIQMDVKLLSGKDAANSYFAILFNYRGENDTSWFSVYPNANVQFVHYYTATNALDKLANNGKGYKGGNLKSGANGGNAFSSSFKDTFEGITDTEKPLLQVPLTVRIEVDTNAHVARSYVNNVFIRATTGDAWDTYFTGDVTGNPIGIRFSPNAIKAEVDNIFVATGCAGKNLEAVTVTFDANGGTLPADIPAAVTVLKGGTIASSGSMTALPILVNTTTHRFAGWAPQGSMTVIGAEDTFSANTTLVAQWEEISNPVEITFNTGFEDVVVGKMTINKGDCLSANDLPKPEKDGYRFVGWKLDGSIMDAEPVIFTESEELVAEWVETVEISFVTGNNSTIDPITIDKNSSLNEQLPTLDNTSTHTFLGWAPQGSTTVIGADDTFSANTTLVAQWKEIPVPSYTVNFNSAGGSAVQSQTIVSGNRVSKPADPVKADSVFAGWYNGDTPYDFNTAVTGPLTLTAHWGPSIVYKQTFDELPTTLTDSALLRELGWTAESGATARFSLEEGRLIADNNVTKAKHSNYLIRTQEQLANVMQKTYTIQMDVEILDLKNKNSNFALLFNYDEGKDYSGGAVVPLSGDVSFQQYVIDKDGKLSTDKLGTTKTVNIVELLPTDTQWGPSDKLLQGVNLRLRVEVDTNEARLYINDILINQTTAAKWNKYFGDLTTAFGIRLTEHWIKVAIDNIVVANGIGIPANAGIPELEKPKPEVPKAEQPTGIDPLLFALAARYAQRFDVIVLGEHCDVTGDMTIKYKRNGTVQLEAEEGYQIVDVVANSQSLGVVNEVTFKIVTKNPELIVITEKIPEQVPVE